MKNAQDVRKIEGDIMQEITITQEMVVKLMLECDAKKQISAELEKDWDAKGECKEAEGFVDGVKFVLGTLGIFIDGVNYSPKSGAE